MPANIEMNLGTSGKIFSSVACVAQNWHQKIENWWVAFTRTHIRSLLSQGKSEQKAIWFSIWICIKSESFAGLLSSQKARNTSSRSSTSLGGKSAKIEACTKVAGGSYKQQIHCKGDLLQMFSSSIYAQKVKEDECDQILQISLCLPQILELYESYDGQCSESVVVFFILIETVCFSGWSNHCDLVKLNVSYAVLYIFYY